MARSHKIFSPKSFWLRFSIPAVLGTGAIGAAFVYPGIASGSTPTLAAATPSAVLAMALAPSAKVYSGSVNETGNLGLPTSLLSSLGSQGSLGVSGLLAQALGGSVSANFWTDHAGNARVQVPTSDGEIDLYASPSALWEWNSASNTATSLSLGTSATTSTGSTSATSGLTPAQIADAIISKLPAGATMSLAVGQYVAGQPAYTLVLNANDPKSLIGNVSVAVDANSGNVLGVWVYPVGSSSAAFSSLYSSVSFVAPSSSVFAFSPPSGATVKTLSLPSFTLPSFTSSTMTSNAGGAYSHSSFGSGFSTVEVIKSPTGSFSFTSNPTFASILASGTSVTTAMGSGTVISMSLGTVFIGNDGVLAFGAVPSSVLIGDLG